MPESWLPVVGFEEEYEVSNLGRVRSLDRIVYRSKGHTRQAKGKILSAYTDKNHPYPAVRLREHIQRSVHKLVAEAFLGPRPIGCEVCHKNGTHSDNVVTNLYWGTRKQNMQDAKRHGVLRGYDKSGENNPHAKLTREQIAQIRTRIAAGDRQANIASTYSITQSYVSQLKYGHSWAERGENQ